MTNSPYQPGDPRYGPQPQPGQYPPQGGFPPPNQPYGQPPNQTPYGAPPPYPGPVPGGTYPPGPPFPPPPKKKRTGLWVTLGIVGALLLIVVVGGVARVVIGAAQGGSAVQDTTDVAVGECIVVTAEPDTLEAREVSCADTGFHYVVADKAITQGLCGPNYSRFWIAGEDGALCLAQVYQEGRCYFLPTATGGNALAETREIECGSPVSGGTNIRVDSKTSAEPQCTDSDGTYFAEKPRPVGYCFSLVE
ncbi:hypothetical protein [Gordonia sp. 'Campus']|uniref:hypothetical protein n=1 Tax=Gordonia sp. 'Campus' TaxID=2915824 RepID=UPI001EE4BB05|nr:hypothetical protein [Gordonia sp. 'Campus']